MSPSERRRRQSESYQPAERLTHAGTGGPLVGYGLASPTRCVNGKTGWYQRLLSNLVARRPLLPAMHSKDLDTISDA
jgi:hypothetical protein